MKARGGGMADGLPIDSRGRKNRDLGNRASPPSQMNTSKFLRRNEW